ncbi:MAG: hypothetical protein RLZZ322_1160 [Verrucomicrobiota bacterium]|jgi:hypothetical protein
MKFGYAFSTHCSSCRRPPWLLPRTATEAYGNVLGLKWLKEGRVCDLVVLGNTHLDIGAPSAPWMRDWIKRHGSEKLGR